MKTQNIEELRNEFEKLVAQGYTLGESWKKLGLSTNSEFVKSYVLPRQKEAFFELIASGYCQRTAAKNVGISEVSVSRWMKNSQKNILRRLKESVLNELKSMDYKNIPEAKERISELLRLLEQLNKAMKLA